MSANLQPLLDFIDSMKREGASDDFVVSLLRQNGWSEKRIFQAFSAWYITRIGTPIPSGGNRIEAAKDAFLYLLAFITLGIWTIQLGSLLFKTIDRSFPNPALDFANYSYNTRSMADSLAGILVAFPLFLLVTWAIVRGVQRQSERLESSVRKWLTYLALVITAGVMIGDIVTFLAYLLRGDLDTRFVLKVLTVLIISAVVFGYYLDSLNREVVSVTRDRAFALAAIVLVGFGVTAGFKQLGSPSVQRYIAQDSRRLFDISSLAFSINNKWRTTHDSPFVLPANIQSLPLPGTPTGVSIVDPVTGRPYQYLPSPGTTYRLCGTFAVASAADIPTQWRHPSGDFCFSLDATEQVTIVPRQW